MKSKLRRCYIALAWLALLWAVGNTVYVYLVLDGQATFRVESAAFILVGVLLPLIVWPPSAGRHEPALTATDTHWLMLLAVSLWLLTIVPFLTLPFLSDDYVFLASDRQWSDALTVGHFFRPMFGVVFLLLSRIGHGSTAPFHVLALLIHGASAWCVYVLSRRLFQRTDAATLCFAIFLLNPLQLEAVLWVSGLQELLWTLFMAAGLVVYTGAPLLSVSRLTLTLVLITCALLSKETALSAVLLLPAADWTFFRMKRGTLLPAAYAGFGILAAVYLFARTQSAPIESGYLVTPGKYFAQKFVGTPYKFFVQPWNLMAANIPAIVLCAAAVTALAVLFWAVVRGVGAIALVGPAVIFISTLPVYAYFYVAPDLRATRYLYFAAIGWALLVTQLLTTVLVRRRSLTVVIATVILILFASLQVNVKPWRTAGEIVGSVVAAIREGKSPEGNAAAWQARYGDGLELKDGVPTVYMGVYLFVNGYPELRMMLTNPKFVRYSTSNTTAYSGEESALKELSPWTFRYP
jgi:hypothetical protein